MRCCAELQLITIIRQDLNLTKSGVSGANVAAITGTIFARVASEHLLRPFCRLMTPCLLDGVNLCSSHAVPTFVLDRLSLLGLASTPVHAVGSFCDAFGPRLGHAFLLSCSSTAGEPCLLPSPICSALAYLRFLL